MAKKIFKKWTEEEVDLLIKNSTESKEKLLTLFPDRTYKSIKHKIKNMNLPEKRYYYRFTEEETILIKENYHLPKEELLPLFPNRTWESLIQKMDEFDLPRDKAWSFWSDEEVEIIKRYEEVDEMKKFLPNRTESQIYYKAKSLGKKFNDKWTAEEDEVLIDNYGKFHVNEFMHLLPDRSEHAIYLRANRLGLKGIMGRYEISDEDIIGLLDEGVYPAEIARRYDVTTTTITNRLKRSGISFEQTFFKGEDHPSWKGGKRTENVVIRASTEYREWREEVFKRDRYICQCCGDDNGGNLRAHHIENFATNESKRFDIDNGITLCKFCHDPQYKGSFHHTYGTINNTRKQLDDYISNKRFLK